jgi:hypothetical protein
MGRSGKSLLQRHLTKTEEDMAFSILECVDISLKIPQLRRLSVILDGIHMQNSSWIRCGRSCPVDGSGQSFAQCGSNEYTG